MANRLELELAIRSAVQKDLDNIQKKISEVVDQADKGFKKAGSSFTIFQGTVASGIALKAFDALIDTAKELFDAIAVQGVRSATEFQQSLQSLANALAQNGKFTEEGIESFENFASAMQSATKFSDDAVISNGALIASLTGLSGQALQDATQAALDFASATGRDLRTASELVAKGIEGQTSAFTRYGIQVKKGKTDTENFNNVLEALNQRFGGRAISDADTFSGAMAKLGNAFEDILKEAGKIIISNPVLIESFNFLKEIFESLTATIKANATTLGTDFSQAILIAVDSLAALTIGLEFVEKIAKGIEAAFRIVATAIAGTVSLIVSSLEGNFKGALEGFKEQFATSFQEIADDATGPTFSGKILENLAELRGRLAGVAGENAKLIINPENIQANVAAAAQLTVDEALKLRDELQAIDIENNEFLTELDRAKLESKRIDNEIFLAQTLGNEKSNFEDRKKIAKKFNDDEKKLQKERAENMKSSLAVISTLQQSSSQELFRIGQAAALATAIIEGIGAVQKALNSAPPPFNFVIAGLVGTAVAANVAKIASAQPPKFQRGIDSVPAGFNNDSFPALLSSGERVVPAQSNRDLTNFLREEEGSAETLASIDAKLSRLQNQTVVNIGDREIINVLNDALQSGRQLRFA